MIDIPDWLAVLLFAGLMFAAFAQIPLNDIGRK